MMVPALGNMAHFACSISSVEFNQPGQARWIFAHMASTIYAIFLLLYNTRARFVVNPVSRIEIVSVQLGGEWARQHELSLCAGSYL